MAQYEPMEVLNSIKEPFNKNTVWIYPGNEDIEVRIFNKGWKTVVNTKDLGLSEESKQQVEKLVNEAINVLNYKFNREYGKHKGILINLMEKNKQLEQKLSDLENKLDKLTKRYSTLLVKN